MVEKHTHKTCVLKDNFFFLLQETAAQGGWLVYFRAQPQAKQGKVNIYIRFHNKITPKQLIYPTIKKCNLKTLH